MGEFLRSRDDYGLYFGGESPVGIGYGSFVLEIEHIPHAADYVAYSFGPADIHRKPVILNYLYPVDAFRSLTDDVKLLRIGEEAPLVMVDTHGNHYFVEHGEGSPEYVQMPCSERVE